MIILENVTLYICSFCKKRLIKEHAMVRHEEFCTFNPNNHPACSGCVHLEEPTKSFGDGYDNDGGLRTREIRTFYCSKLKKALYPMKVVKKGLLKKYPDTFKDQELMPIVCEHLSYEMPGLVNTDQDFEY